MKYEINSPLLTKDMYLTLEVTDVFLDSSIIQNKIIELRWILTLHYIESKDTTFTQQSSGQANLTDFKLSVFVPFEDLTPDIVFTILVASNGGGEWISQNLSSLISGIQYQRYYSQLVHIASPDNLSDQELVPLTNRLTVHDS